MKVYVLGAEGFIGRHVVKALEASSHEITPYCYSSDTSWIVNCAGHTNSNADLHSLFHSNVALPVDIWTDMPKGCRLLQLDTTDPTDNPYSRSKAAVRLLLDGARNVSTLRLGTVFGNGDRESSFVSQVLQCAGDPSSDPIHVNCDGTSTRRFTYIKDVVDAILIELERPNSVNWATTRYVDGDVKSLISAANLIWREIHPHEYAPLHIIQAQPASHVEQLGPRDFAEREPSKHGVMGGIRDMLKERE